MTKYYDLRNILKKDAHYNMIFGERSNGKTYACLLYGLERYCKYSEEMAIIRRWSEDITGKRASVLFNALIENNVIDKLTKHTWDNVYYYAGKWYLCRYEGDKRICDNKPFCYGFAISQYEHDKSTSYPNVTTIIFDEFLTRNVYLRDEFISFMNTISTIIRQRNNVKIFMLGNTVSKYCPYFSEMGLTNIQKMNQGEIDLYTYGNSDLKVAVEYCSASENKNKKSNIYFAFNNPKLNMIKNGIWEFDIYPHCTYKYKHKDVLYVYMIEFDGNTLQCEIINSENKLFTFIHKKTTPIKLESCLIYSTTPNPEYYRRMFINRPITDLERKIYSFFLNKNVFYQDNEVGDIVSNYLKWCKINSGV